jgi:hypothetical protein
MEFKNYWSGLSPAQKISLADKANTSVNHLCQVANGHRNAGANLISRLMQADKKLTPAMLRPDLFKVA